MPPDRRIVERAFFERHPLLVAYDLIGTVLRVQRDGADVSGRIVEVEAYGGPLDLASHSSRMQSALALLSGTPGCLYMYRSYGIHTMLNVIAHEPEGTGGILIRALEPLAGLEKMRERRGGPEKSLGKGPGVLTQSFGLRLTDIGVDITTSREISFIDGPTPGQILASERIGITRGLSARWRLFLAGSSEVSAHRRGDFVVREELSLLLPPPGTVIV